MVAAAVAATDTTMDPATGPKMTPAVIVSGTAGTARISSNVYTPPYAKYLLSKVTPLRLKSWEGQTCSHTRQDKHFFMHIYLQCYDKWFCKDFCAEGHAAPKGILLTPHECV